MESSFKSLIEQSKSILILLPTKPYFDQVASGLALYLALREVKEVQVYSPSPMTVEFNRLIGVNKVSLEMGNKNLIIRFIDYKASDIERVSYDIENGQFRLTVIPKPKVSPPLKDQVELAYSGVTSDTVIMIGGANETHFPALSSKDLSGSNIVHIGTRDISLASNKSYVSFSRPASSVSEIIASLIKESGLKLDEDVATNLLMGLEQASNNFTDSAVSADTFSVVSELMRAGGKRASLQSAAKPTDFPPGAIPGQMLKPQSFTSHQTGQAPLMPPQTVQTKPIVTTQQPKDIQTKSPDKKEEAEEIKEPPKDWLQPKIYKGTSIS